MGTIILKASPVLVLALSGVKTFAQAGNDPQEAEINQPPRSVIHNDLDYGPDEKVDLGITRIPPKKPRPAPVRSSLHEESNPLDTKLANVVSLGERLAENRANDKEVRGAFVRDYSRLYRELHEERRGLMREASKSETTKAHRNSLTNRFRAISEALDGLPAPAELNRNSRRPDAAGKTSLDQYIRKTKPPLADYGNLRNEAQRTINTSDSAAADRMLRRMKRDYNQRRDARAGTIQPDMAEYRDYIADYEKALDRKWPNRRRTTGYSRLPVRRDSYVFDPFTGELNIDQDTSEYDRFGYPLGRDADGARMPPGATDPMRRHGLDETDLRARPTGRLPDTFSADSIRNRRHIENARKSAPSDDTIPEADPHVTQQPGPTPPRIGDLPEVKGGPELQTPIDYPDAP